MSDEIKAAAERLRRVANAEPIVDIYCPRKSGEIHTHMAPEIANAAHEQDAWRVARAYLAEHDETPIDEAWLRMTLDMATDDWGILARDLDEISLTFIEGTFGVTFNSPDIECKTRGDVRRLCDALSIPLTESKEAI